MSEEQEFKYSSEAAALRRKLAETGRSAATDVVSAEQAKRLFYPLWCQKPTAITLHPIKTSHPVAGCDYTSRDETLFSS